MSRILMTTLGSLGDLHPLIAIGLELQRRGHLVRFCASETYRDKLESLGFGFAALRPDATPENAAMVEMVRQIMDPKRGAERLLRGYLMPRLRETYEDLLRAVVGPPQIDLLLAGELVYPAPLLAEKFGLHSATYITAPMSFFSAHDPPTLPPFPGVSNLMRRLGPGFNGAFLSLVKRVTRSWTQPVRELRRELGLKAGANALYEGKFSMERVLALFSPVLAQPQPDWPTNALITGYPFYDGSPKGSPMPAQLIDFLDSGERPIVFTLGSSAVLDPGKFYDESAKAAASLKRRAILLVGPNDIPAHLPHGVAAFGYVRFSELFPRAAAIVHQGGIGTTGQALRAGCPMLVMPYNFDQPDNAARIVRLGAGRTLPRRRYSAERVAQELKLLLDQPQYRLRAAELGARVAAENGAAVAADALEGLLNEKLSQRSID